MLSRSPEAPGLVQLAHGPIEVLGHVMTPHYGSPIKPVKMTSNDIKHEQNYTVLMQVSKDGPPQPSILLSHPLGS